MADAGPGGLRPAGTAREPGAAGLLHLVLDPPQAKRELRAALPHLQARALFHSARWAAELLVQIPDDDAGYIGGGGSGEGDRDDDEYDDGKDYE